MDMFPAARSPVPLEVPGVLRGPRRHSHQNTAISDTRFIIFDTRFGYPPVSKRSDQAARKAYAAGGRQGRGDGPGHDEP
jgi:hypothetical protein